MCPDGVNLGRRIADNRDRDDPCVQAEGHKTNQEYLADRFNDEFEVGIRVGIVKRIVDGLHLSLLQDLHGLLSELGISFMQHQPKRQFLFLGLLDERLGFGESQASLGCGVAGDNMTWRVSIYKNSSTNISRIPVEAYGFLIEEVALLEGGGMSFRTRHRLLFRDVDQGRLPFSARMCLTVFREIESIPR